MLRKIIDRLLSSLPLDTFSTHIRRLYNRYLWWRLSREIRKEHPYCAVCGSTKNLEVHHIYPKHVCPDRILDRDNLIVLCHECHLRFGHLGDYEAYNPLIKTQAEKIRNMLCNGLHAYLADAKNRRLKPKHIKNRVC